MGGKWPSSCCFVGCCFQDLFKTVCSILVLFSSIFFSSKCFTEVQMVKLCNNSDMITIQKNNHFIVSERSYLHMIVNLWTPSLGHTSENLNLSALCRHWMLSKRLAKSDERLGRMAGESQRKLCLWWPYSFSYRHLKAKFQGRQKWSLSFWLLKVLKNTRLSLKFCNILYVLVCNTYIMWLKQFKPW